MAYIKFKELTKYFNFHQRLQPESLPEFVSQYMMDNEKVLAAYGTMRDKCVFTDKKIIIFDQQGITSSSKKIQIFPHCSVDSSAIVFKKESVYLLYTYESGYQTRLNFVNLNPEDKKELRILFNEIANVKIINRTKK